MTITKNCTRCKDWIEVKTPSGFRHTININNISKIVEPSNSEKICFIHVYDNCTSNFVTADIAYNELRDILMSG